LISAFPLNSYFTRAGSYSISGTDPRPSRRRKLVLLLPLKKPPTAKQKFVPNRRVSSIPNPQSQETKKPLFVKYGLNHTVALIEAKKASLVVIAHDVDPIELVVYLPALCRKMGVPYVIVKGKARLGTVVHKKTAAVLTIEDVRSEDQRELTTIISAAKANL